MLESGPFEVLTEASFCLGIPAGAADELLGNAVAFRVPPTIAAERCSITTVSGKARLAPTILSGLMRRQPRGM